MTSPAQDASLNAAEKPSELRLLKKTLIATIVLYAAFFACSIVSFIFAYYAFYFWAYIGVPVAAVTFTATLLATGRVFHKRRHRLQFAAQLSAIAFMVAGDALMVMTLPLSGQSVQMAGYALHTKIWLDADEARAWANKLDLSQNSALSPIRWPLTLKIVALPAGSVIVDEETRDVTVGYGSALSGHCGVHITARGKNWAGERWADTSKYDRIRKIEDGVWIWSSMH